MMLQFRALTLLCDTGFSLFNFGHRIRRNRVSGLIDAAHRGLPPTCEEILPGPNSTFTLDQFHALENAAAALQAVTPDNGERKTRMERTKEQLDAGQVDRVIAAL